MADVDPAEYHADAEAEENVLLKELYPSSDLGEIKPAKEEVDLTCRDDDLDLDCLADEENPSAGTGNDNKDIPEKKKRKKIEPPKVAEKNMAAMSATPSSLSTPKLSATSVASAKVSTNPAGLLNPNEGTPPPPKLIKASKKLTLAGPPRAQINPIHIPKLTPAPPKNPPLRKEETEDKKEGEFRPRNRGRAPSSERGSSSREHRSRSGSSHERCSRERHTKEHHVILTKRDKGEDGDLRSQLRKKGQHGSGSTTATRRGTEPPIPRSGASGYPNPGPGYREQHHPSGGPGPAPHWSEKDPVVRGDRGHYGLGYMDQPIKISGKYRGMERGAYEGGVEGWNVRVAALITRDINIQAPRTFNQVKEDFQDPGGQRPSESGFLPSPARGGGGVARMAQQAPRGLYLSLPGCVWEYRFSAEGTNPPRPFNLGPPQPSHQGVYIRPTPCHLHGVPGSGPAQAGHPPAPLPLITGLQQLNERILPQPPVTSRCIFCGFVNVWQWQ